MIAALDATPLSITSGGLRRYVEELAKALAAEFPEDQYRLLTDQRVTWLSPSANLTLHAQRPRNWMERRWWLLGVQRRMNNADVFHGTAFSVPYLPLRPSVLTLHDLSPWKDPAWHDGASRVRRRTPLLLRLGIGTMVITPTEAIRAEAIEYFSLAPSRVACVPEAAPEHFGPGEPWSRQPYFLFAGTVEPRKRVPWLIECWRHVYGMTGARLVLAGRFRSDAPSIQPEPGLEILGEVADSLLPSLYTGAIASIYPSAYEGFGLPVLEAMRCGCPVITSTSAALKETAGNAAVIAEDERALIDAMLHLARDEQLRGRYRDAGLRRAAEFSWQRSARETRAVYQEAIRRFGG